MAPINYCYVRVNQLVDNLINGDIIGHRLFFRYNKTSTAFKAMIDGLCSLSEEELDEDKDNYLQAQIVIFSPLSKENPSESSFYIRLETYIDNELNIPFQIYVDNLMLRNLLVSIFKENHDCYDLAGNLYL